MAGSMAKTADRQKAGQSRAQRAEAAARKSARQEKMQRVQLVLGIVFVIGTVAASLVLALLHQIHPAAAVGLTLLALFRGWILKREIKQQDKKGENQ